jgi:hypothetical protein
MPYKNKRKTRAYNKSYYDSNAVDVLDKKKDYYKKNKNQILNVTKSYYNKNHAQIKLARKVHYNLRKIVIKYCVYERHIKKTSIKHFRKEKIYYLQKRSSLSIW